MNTASRIEPQKKFVPMIQLNSVSVFNHNYRVFNSLDLRLESGVSYLIKGSNGVGKTMLLKLIAGKIQPRKGIIKYNFIDDHLNWDEKYELRKKYIHFVPTLALHDLISTPDLFYQQRYYTIESTPLTTVRDYLGERLNHPNLIQLPSTFQLNHILDLELTHLSNGQLKKLIILKRLLDSIPHFLILDYPFEGLDVESRIELRDFLDHLVSTHQIQLIIADNEHPQLPQSITKTIILDKDRSLIISHTVAEHMSFGIETIPVPKIMESETVVELCEVKIKYGDKVILENVNWKINRGERWALTGRNGSGKTTLFSLIYADHPLAYSEKVYLFGKRRGTGESIWDIKKRISYLGPEQFHFLDYTTEQLTVNEYLEKSSTGTKRLNDLIDFFQLDELLFRKLMHLSNGQLQLILLINLFSSQKELLLLDEPFQFLDPHYKKRVNDYLEMQLEESVTMILITHYANDVERWTNFRMTL